MRIMTHIPIRKKEKKGGKKEKGQQEENIANTFANLITVLNENLQNEDLKNQEKLSISMFDEEWRGFCRKVIG